MKLSKNIVRKGATLALMTAMVFSSAVPAFAADTVTMGITAGALDASVADLNLTPVGYGFAAKPTNGGSMTLTASDATGQQAGWHVTILSGDFVWTAGGSGALTGSDIAPINFSIGTPGGPAMTAGQAVNATGPLASVGGTLEQARTVISAGATSGNGTYTQALPVNLAIPENSSAGTYTATLVTTISAGE